MSPVRTRLWNGVRFVDEGEDDFLFETTVPKSTFVDLSALPSFYKTFAGGSDNVGLLEGPSTISGLEPFTDYSISGGKAYVAGTSSIASPRIIRDKIFDRPIYQTAQGTGNVHFINCYFTLASPGTSGLAYIGLINANAAGTDRWTTERCHFDPTEEFAHHAISASMGHHLSLIRSTWQRVVDGYSGYRLSTDASKVLASEVLGCMNIYNSYFWHTSTGVVHPSDDETHNDAIQIQGGGPGDGYTYGIDVRGNLFIGYNFLADGVTPPGTDTPAVAANRHLAHQAVLTQQNEARSTVMNPRIRGNWIGGFSQPFTHKTHALSGSSNTVSDGTPYNVVLENNRFIEDDQGVSGSSSGTDFYGVTGGHTHLLRVDPDISVNGQDASVYPNDLVARTLTTGDNRFADADNIHANRRGQLIHIRRDATYV